MKLPKIKFPALITTRAESGKKEFIGLTPMEWLISTGVLIGLYLVLAAFFAALLTISQTIRNGGDFYSIPGSDKLIDAGDSE